MKIGLYRFCERLCRRGKSIFCFAVYQKGARTPDVKMDDVFWEMKSPQSNGKHTIEHILRKALKQSKNIIIDLRRSKFSEKKGVSQITKNFKLIKDVNRILIITKSNNVLDLKK
ncbi:MAG: hypothetical protein LBR69_03790 [Endomicrobium sp.]|nr:hypothetical protein [Endomicrobium sp.]